MYKMKVLAFTVVCVFAILCQISAQNVCVQCVQKENVFFFRRNFTFDCVKPDEIKSLKFLLSYKTEEQCKTAVKIMTKKGNSTGMHLFFLPQPPKMTTLVFKESVHVKLNSSQNKSSSLFFPNAKRKILDNDKDFGKSVTFTTEKYVNMTSQVIILKTLAPKSSPVTVKSKESTSTKSSTTTSTRMPIITRMPVTTRMSTTTRMPTTRRIQVVKKYVEKGENETKSVVTTTISSMTVSQELNGTKKLEKKFRKQDKFNSSNPSFFEDARKIFMKAYFYAEILAKADIRFQFLRMWNWLNPLLTNVFPTKLDFDMDKMIQKEMRKIAKLQEDEVIEISRRVFCKAMKYALEIVKTNSAVLSWIFQHPSHQNNEFACQTTVNRQVEMMNFLI